MEGKKDFKFFVIGVGLCRTGTYSTKTALEILLPGKCMHMSEVFKDTKTAMDELYNDDVTDTDFRKYFEKHNYVAGVDIPFNLKYEQAMRVFPDALVLLTIREPEGWVRSMKNTVCHLHGPDSDSETFPYYLHFWLNRPVKRLHDYIGGSTQLKSAINCIKNGNGVEYFDSYTEEIKAKVSADRLLVFNVKEGWKPLCDALGLSIPTQPFPNINNVEMFRNDIIRRRRIISWGMVIVGAVTPLIIGYSLKRHFNTDSLNSIQGLYNNL